MRRYFFDIGNTRLKAWACDRAGQVLAREAIAHEGSPELSLHGLSAAFAEAPAFIGVSCVLGEENRAPWEEACRHRWGRAVEFARSQEQTAGVHNAYAEPERLGVDRWLGVLAVADGQHDYCVADCGTAMTIDVVTREREHLGGYILPGLALLSDSLIRNTRQVRVTQAGDESLAWGRHTSAAVLNGALLATVGAIEAACAHLREDTGREPQLVLTGGDAARLSPLIRYPHCIETELLLIGLQRYFAASGINQLSAPEQD